MLLCFLLLCFLSRFISTSSRSLTKEEPELYVPSLPPVYDQGGITGVASKPPSPTLSPQLHRKNPTFTGSPVEFPSLGVVNLSGTGCPRPVTQIYSSARKNQRPEEACRATPNPAHDHRRSPDFATIEDASISWPTLVEIYQVDPFVVCRRGRGHRTTVDREHLGRTLPGCDHDDLCINSSGLHCGAIGTSCHSELPTTRNLCALLSTVPISVIGSCQFSGENPETFYRPKRFYFAAKPISGETRIVPRAGRLSEDFYTSSRISNPKKTSPCHLMSSELVAPRLEAQETLTRLGCSLLCSS